MISVPGFAAFGQRFKPLDLVVVGGGTDWVGLTISGVWLLLSGWGPGWAGTVLPRTAGTAGWIAAGPTDVCAAI
ncbi:MAG: hypothetical protein WCC64_07195 [Aliidongia sp.]